MIKQNKISTLRHVSQIAYLFIFIAGLLSKNLIFIFITASAVLLGPIFCGWMCYLGLYQDSIRHLGKFIKKEPFEFNEKTHNVLKFSRYVILLGTITLGGYFLLTNELSHSLSQILKGHALFNTAFYALLALGAVSLFTKRFFCRYFCTFGARLGVYSLLKPVTINKSESCVSCKICSKNCLMKVPIDKAHSLVDANCVTCLRCIENCPKGSLKIGLRNYLKP